MTHPSEPAPERGEVEALIERLNGPAQWGYMCLADGGFISDDTPTEAGDMIASLSAEVERLRKD